MNEVTITDPCEPVAAAEEFVVTPMEMLRLALKQGSSMEVLNSLMDLHERAERAVARRQFDAAFAAVKAKIGIIKKTGIGHNRMPYATLADIAGTLDPVIAEQGLSYRYRSQRVGNELIMTCIVCHRAGHFEENSLPAPLDMSGSKNPVQAVGSTCTYLQRYTLIQAFGLAASIEGNDIHDDDGEGAPRISARPPPRPAPNVIRPPVYDPQTGEILDSPSPLGGSEAASPQSPDGGRTAEAPASSTLPGAGATQEFHDLNRQAAEAAKTGGRNELEKLWKRFNQKQKDMMRQRFVEEHAPAADRADAEAAENAKHLGFPAA